MKKRKGITPQDVLRWIAQGYGQGEGRNYRPFFHVRDVPSRGRSSMVMGLKTGRVHHYLSGLEYACHVLAEYETGVGDIREQFALLPWQETQEIADALDIRHPTYPGTTTPIVMTSDIVLTVARSAPQTAVICVKPSSEVNAENPRAQRTLEKLLVEKTYWERRGVLWQLVTEKEIPSLRVKNLDLLRVSMIACEKDWLNRYVPRFRETFELCWHRNRPLREILARARQRMKMTNQDCFCLFARCVWVHLLDIDIDNHRIHHDLPVRRNARGGCRA